MSNPWNAAIEAAAKVCLNLQDSSCDKTVSTYSAQFEAGYASGCEDCENRIRALKNTAGQAHVNAGEQGSVNSLNVGSAPLQATGESRQAGYKPAPAVPIAYAVRNDQGYWVGLWNDRETAELVRSRGMHDEVIVELYAAPQDAIEESASPKSSTNPMEPAAAAPPAIPGLPPEPTTVFPGWHDYDALRAVAVELRKRCERAETQIKEAQIICGSYDAIVEQTNLRVRDWKERAECAEAKLATLKATILKQVSDFCTTRFDKYPGTAKNRVQWIKCRVCDAECEMTSAALVHKDTCPLAGVEVTP